MGNLGTGFLYGFGNGASGENLIPSEITGISFSGAEAGNQIASAIYNHNPESAPLILGQVFSGNKNAKFGFGIYNINNNRSPLSKLEFMSSFSGSGSGGFVSGAPFERDLVIVTKSADPGTSIDRAVLNLGGSLGTGSGIYKYPSDTYINSTKNNLLYLNSDSWLEYSGIFNIYNITGIASGDGGFVIKDVGGNFGLEQNFNLYNINYGSREAFQNTDIVRQKVFIRNLGSNFPVLELKTSDSKVWASYDIASGTNNSGKNVFAYAFEFVDIATTRDSGVIITSNIDNQDPFASYRKLSYPEIKTGFDTSFSSYIGYCFNRLECPKPEDSPEDIEECYTGISNTGKEYADFLSGVLKKFSNQTFVSEFDAVSNLTLSSGESISGLFAYQTGEIFYNYFFTGDSINFNLYNFDYTGLYRSYHLNNAPLFPSSGFSLVYPQDFTGIDSLINKLNERLNNVNYPIWYPYECLSGEASGIYITGNIMYFEKNTGIETGNKNYNNIINFRSLRNYQRGFDIRLNLINRDEYIANLTQEIFKKGFSYLIPNVVELQGLTGNQWIVLDRRSGLYNELTGLKPTKRPLDASPELFPIDNGEYFSSSDITGSGTAEPFQLEEILLSGGFITLQKFVQNGVIPAPAFCSSQTFSREISIIQPTGWPSGIDPCRNPQDFKQEEEEEKDQEEDGGGVEKNELELFLEVRRTGWVLDPTGIYLNCLTAPDYDLSKVNFEKYRIVARDLSSIEPTIENQYIIPLNEIYFTNINLFSLNSSNIGPHTGYAQCLIGADYVVDVEDIIGFPFSTNFQYSITGEDRSGIYRAINQQLVYEPTPEERNVKFIRTSGKIVNNVTGLVNGTFSGSGLASHTFSDRYYYNPDTNEIFFREILTGNFLRSGILSGQSIALKDFVVNQELLIGGRLNTGPRYLETISGGIFTGLLTGVSYTQDNVTGLYNLTGQISGFSSGGYFNYSKLVSGIFLSGLAIATGEFTNFTNLIFDTGIDFIDDNIQISRANNGSIFNPLYQTSWSDNNWSSNSGSFFGTPAFTLWNRDGWSGFTGIGIDNITGRSFISFYDLWGGGQIGNNVVNDELIMWDILNNNYYAIKFTGWSAGGLGGFGYIRSKNGTGEFISFTKLDPIRIADDIDANLSIYRDTNGSIFNPLYQTSWSDNNWSSNSGSFFGTPAFTLWNRDGWSGLLDSSVSGITGKTFISFYNLWGGGQIGSNVVGDELIMWDFINNKYYVIKFTEWQAGGGGKFTYERSSISFEPVGKDNFPYYPVPTGYQQASGVISINYSNIQNFDLISINNNSINYHSNTGIYFEPDYFHNTDSLINIINTSPTLFNCTGIKLSDSGILLIANDFRLGFEGNDILLTGNGSGFIFSSNFLTDGRTFFPRLDPTTSFSGIAQGSIGSTGIFLATGSGIITGDIKTFTGVRSFTGIWDIKTGIDLLLSFLGNNFISGEIYKNTEIFSEIYNNLQIQIFYDNELNTNNSDPIDISEIKIKDNNFNLLDNPPTGENGEFIFRITGVRTV
jgi:hypothetical protein